MHFVHVLSTGQFIGPWISPIGIERWMQRNLPDAMYRIETMILPGDYHAERQTADHQAVDRLAQAIPG